MMMPNYDINYLKRLELTKLIDLQNIAFELREKQNAARKNKA